MWTGSEGSPKLMADKLDLVYGPRFEPMYRTFHLEIFLGPALS